VSNRHILTPEERSRGGRKGGQTRAMQASFAAHNAAIAPAGYRAACAKHGEARILQAAIAKQRARPSQPEQCVMRILRSLGADGYVHIHQPWPDRRFTVDFAWLDARRAVEVLGGIHFVDELSNDPDMAARLQRKLDALAADGWQVLVLDIRHQADWPAQLAGFAPQEIPF